MGFKLKMLFSVPLFIWISDQLTKYWVRAEIALGDHVQVIPNVFDIVHYRNRGAAFGMFAESGEWRTYFFYGVSVIAFIGIIIYLLQLPEIERASITAFTLILGGVLGNVTDRFFFGEVTDFLSVHWGDKMVDTVFFGYPLRFPLEWPAFNIADSAITIAMVILFATIVIEYNETRRLKREES